VTKDESQIVQVIQISICFLSEDSWKFKCFITWNELLSWTSMTHYCPSSEKRLQESTNEIGVLVTRSSLFGLFLTVW